MTHQLNKSSPILLSLSVVDYYFLFSASGRVQRQKVILKSIMGPARRTTHADGAKAISSSTKIAAYIFCKLHYGSSEEQCHLEDFSLTVFGFFLYFLFNSSCCRAYDAASTIRVHSGSCYGNHACESVKGDFIAYKNSCTGDW